MTAQISAYGRLVADPQTRTTTNGNNMAMAVSYTHLTLPTKLEV